MYIKAWWNKRDFAGSIKPHCGRGREGPCFAVCAAVCDLSLKAKCVPTFDCESKRGPFVQEVEKHDENLDISEWKPAIEKWSMRNKSCSPHNQ